jgi:hypothetical protein
MKVLFDECAPWPLHKILPDHACVSVQQRGWRGAKNGRLLSLAQPEFDLFLTSDQNLAYQQNLLGRRIAVLQLSTNKLRRLLAAAPLIQSAVATIRPGELRRLDIP